MALSHLMVQKALREEQSFLRSSPHSEVQSSFLVHPASHWPVNHSDAIRCFLQVKSYLCVISTPQKCGKLMVMLLLIINPNLVGGNQKVLRKVGPVLLVVCPYLGLWFLISKVCEILISPQNQQCSTSHGWGNMNFFLFKTLHSLEHWDSRS